MIDSRCSLLFLVGLAGVLAQGSENSARIEAAGLRLKTQDRVNREAASSRVVRHSKFRMGEDGVIQLTDAPHLRLNAKGGELQPGDPLVLYPCSPHMHELFNMTSGGLIRLVANNDLCLQAKGGLTIGNEIVTYPCAQGGIAKKHEKFTMTEDGRIRAMSEPDLCMNVKEGKLDSGGQLVLWWCGKGKDAVNELFTYSGGMIMLKHNPDLRFNIAGGDTQNHLQPVNLWHCQPHQHEMFEFTKEGALRVKGRPDLCVNAEGGLHVSNRLVLWPCSSPLVTNERWMHDPGDSSIYAVDHPIVGFNAKGGAMQQGDEIVLWWLHEREEL